MINDFDKSSIDMVDWSCASCGCIQWMPKTYNEQLRTTHGTFYCTNGHANVYSKRTPQEEIELKLSNEYAKNAQLEARVKDLEKQLSDLSQIKISLREISEKANSSFLQRLFK